MSLLLKKKLSVNYELNLVLMKIKVFMKMCSNTIKKISNDKFEMNYETKNKVSGNYYECIKLPIGTTQYLVDEKITTLISQEDILKINESEFTWNSEMKIYSDINYNAIVITLRNGNYFLTDEDGKDIELAN